ncbi:B12-binding domain-containing radical SAM protein [Chloroflexota bacterium]
MDERAKRVLLVNPNQTKPAVSPLALDYLAHALRQNQFQVDMLDLCFVDDAAQAIEGYFAHGDVMAVGVTLRNSDDAYFASQGFFVPGFKEIIDHLKGHTSAPLILGGIGFSIMPEAILDYCGLDIGIWGEGEHSLPLLLSRMAAGQEYRDVPALIYRSETGFHCNPAAYLDLGHLPAPERSTVDNKRYFAEGAMGNLESKRGCPKGCIYCADPIGKGRRFRLRSPQGVVDEMEALLQAGIDHLYFCDSEFNLPYSHAKEICLEIISRGLGTRVRWYAYASPAPFSAELALLFRKSGCAGVNFGVDSGDERMLRTLGRDFTVDDLKHTAALCHKHSVVFMYDLLLGGPGETRESLRKTIEIMKRLSPDRVGAALGVRVYPQTKLAVAVRRKGPLASNPDLHGWVRADNPFFVPVFFLSSALGPDAAQYLARLVGGDERFFLGSTDADNENYNYNENELLVNAIKEGYRGAFWDILRRMRESQQ